MSIGFYANWDDNSYPALKRALPHLDWIIPGWLSLEGPGMELKSDVDARVLSYIQTTKPNMPILPMIQNATEGEWNGEGLVRLLADPVARAARIEAHQLRAHLALSKQDKGYAELAKQTGRSLGPLLVGWAAGNPGRLRDLAVANADVKELLRLTREQALAFPARERPGRMLRNCVSLKLAVTQRLSRSTMAKSGCPA